MPRMIALYEKTGEKLINRFDLLYDDVSFFRKLLGNPTDDPMLYGVYRIDEKQNEMIFKHLGVSVDLIRFDAFIEYGEELK